MAKKKAAKPATRKKNTSSARVARVKTKSKPAPKPTTKKVTKKATKKATKKVAKKAAPVKRKKTVKKAKNKSSKVVSKPASRKKPPSKPKASTPATNKKVKASKPRASLSKTRGGSTRAMAADDQAIGPEPLTIAQLRKIKSGLTKREIQGYRQLLLQKRSEIIGDVTAMQNDACNKNSNGNLSHMPVHMADIGSDNYEQEFTLGLVESERRLLYEIVNALGRITNGIYGVCEESGVPIGKPRLDAKPWARYCIAVARERERQGIK